MNNKSRISIIIGTRPEAIKFIPIIEKLKSEKLIDLRIILTGQHEDLVDEIFQLFNFKEDINLKLFKLNQSLSYMTRNILDSLEKEFINYPPNIVLVQGDTTSAFVGALAAFYQKIRVGHIEAGLRTNDVLDPYPEEANRRLISQIAYLHFAPTKFAYDNLKNSNVSGKIFKTGNTVIDTLFKILKKEIKEFKIEGLDWESKKIILTTIHRRENWGKILELISGIQKLTKKHDDIQFIIPCHPNKIVSNPLKKHLGDNSQVFLVNHLRYDQMAFVMKKCKLVLTDSGGIQEEAPSLGKPVLVLRDKTEREESIIAGVAKLIGCNKNNIFKQVDKLVLNDFEYKKMTKSINPYGDGHASQRIVEQILKYLK